MRNKSRKAMRGIAVAMMAAMMLAGGTPVYAEDATGACLLYTSSESMSGLPA